MKSIFSAIALLCATVLLIAGSTVAGVIFAICGFLGAIASAALRQHNEQEAIKAIKEFTETLKKNSTSEEKTASMEEAIGQLSGALGELFQALSSINPETGEPWDPKKNNGGKGGNGGGSGWSH